MVRSVYIKVTEGPDPNSELVQEEGPINKRTDFAAAVRSIASTNGGTHLHYYAGQGLEGDGSFERDLGRRFTGGPGLTRYGSAITYLESGASAVLINKIRY